MNEECQCEDCQRVHEEVQLILGEVEALREWNPDMGWLDEVEQELIEKYPPEGEDVVRRVIQRERLKVWARWAQE